MINPLPRFLLYGKLPTKYEQVFYRRPSRFPDVDGHGGQKNLSSVTTEQVFS